jgi:hypothetical protein
MAPTTSHASRVDTTRPTSIDAASPDPTGLSPSVEFSASEATPFECALDGVALAECTSTPESPDGLDTFGAEGPTLTEDDPRREQLHREGEECDEDEAGLVSCRAGLSPA